MSKNPGSRREIIELSEVPLGSEDRQEVGAVVDSDDGLSIVAD